MPMIIRTPTPNAAQFTLEHHFTTRHCLRHAAPRGPQVVTAPIRWEQFSRASRAEQSAVQAARLRRHVQQELVPFSAHYRRVFAEAKVRADQIQTVDDLRRLPFTTKQDLLA